jgi:hypothetical protein
LAQYALITAGQACSGVITTGGDMSVIMVLDESQPIRADARHRDAVQARFRIFIISSSMR